MEEENINENEEIHSTSYSLNKLLKSKSCQISKEKEKYLWNNAIFSQQLYEILTTEDSEIISKYEKYFRYIENILMGDFGISKEKIIYSKEFFYISYILNSKEDNFRLLFVIYFTKVKSQPDYFVEVLEFLDILEGTSNLQDAIINFQNEHLYCYKNLEYDKHCLIDANVFFKLTKNENGKLIRYPYDFDIKDKSDKVKKITFLGEERNKEYIDLVKLLPESSTIIINVLNILRNKETLDYDLILKKNIIDFVPSKTEKKLINNNKNFILSGRPGTGKTFIILIKAFLTYLNCLIEHSKQEVNKIDWDFIKNKYSNQKKKNNDYKIVVTSLSQILCQKSEELFSRCMRDIVKDSVYKPTSLDEIKNLNSFQNIKKYPLFVNFRKLIFLIDGSLNFQFFDRPTDNKMNKLDNDCDIKYIPKLEYDVQYEVNIYNIGLLNYFYRSQYGNTFKVGMGAAAIKQLLSEVDVEKELVELQKELDNATGQKRIRLVKRLDVINSFATSARL